MVSQNYMEDINSSISNTCSVEKHRKSTVGRSKCINDEEHISIILVLKIKWLVSILFSKAYGVNHVIGLFTS